MAYIFLSYSRNDGNTHVEYLEQAIRAHCGQPVWRDIRGIDPAQDFGAELEKAIEGASHVVVCLTKDTKRENSFVRREIGYAMAVKKPIFVARFEDIPPQAQIVNNTYLDFFKPPPEKHLATLCEWFSRSDYQIPPLETDDPYRPYLESLLQFTVNFLKGSVIRDIELDVTDRPDQVPARPKVHNPLQARIMPWFRPDDPTPPTQEEFPTFADAFKAYDGQVVLLGEPGAGKTVTLLNQLRASINERLENPDAPLPLFAFITSWNSYTRQPFPEWLSQNQPLLTPQLVAKALQTGNTTLFLDGLDELGDQREEEIEQKDEEGIVRKIALTHDPRQRFIETLSPFLGAYSRTPKDETTQAHSRAPLHPNRALVTCRIKDYADIGKQIPLRGAVQLNPLSDEQIAEYLKELPELLAAVNADEQLKEMLRIPLLMSLFAFAFRDELTPDQRHQLQDMAHTDAEELRDQIIMLYLERRYQWEESKDLPLPFTYEEWIEKLQIIAYRGVDTFANSSIFRPDSYRGVGELNILLYDNIQLDLGDETAKLIEFSQNLNVLLAIDDQSYRFQHLLLLSVLALPLALPRLEQKQDRANVCRVLGALGSKRAVASLIHALADQKTDVRYSAAVALGQIGDQLAIVPLTRLLTDTRNTYGLSKQRICDIAAIALEKIGTPEALTALEEWLAQGNKIIKGGYYRSYRFLRTEY